MDNPSRWLWGVLRFENHGHNGSGGETQPLHILAWRIALLSLGSHPSSLIEHVALEGMHIDYKGGKRNIPSQSNKPHQSCWSRKWRVANGLSSHSSHGGFRKNPQLPNVASQTSMLHTAYFSCLTLYHCPTGPLHSQSQEMIGSSSNDNAVPPYLW